MTKRRRQGPTKKPVRRVNKRKRRANQTKKAAQALKLKRAGIRKRFPSMLSAKQASDLYGRTIRTVRRWQAALGRNGVKRVGGLVLINRKALMRYILYGR